MDFTSILGAGYAQELESVLQTPDGLFTAKQNGAGNLWTTHDRKATFVEIGETVLCRINSSVGYPAYYPLPAPCFHAPAKAVLMDLDGTSVHSEWFWMWIIERTVSVLLRQENFRLAPEDEPFVSGNSVSEHLQYCLRKYAPNHTLEEARDIYFDVTRYEMAEILAGRGKNNAFAPSPHLKKFLLKLKETGTKIGLVTSGLTEKALPEIVSAFRTLEMGNPCDFYDAIISAGTALGPGTVGTLGELEAKPHPWLYAETGKVGLGYSAEDGCTFAIEDSAAGVISARLAGFPCIGMEGGNIRQSGVACLCFAICNDLMDALPYILG